MSEGADPLHVQDGPEEGRASPLEVPADTYRRIRFGQIKRLVNGHVAVLPALPLLSVFFAFFLESIYPAFVPALWVGAMCLHAALVWGLRRMMQKDMAAVAADPDKWARLYGWTCLFGSFAWSAIVPVFWNTAIPDQSLYVLLVLICTSFFTVTTMTMIPRVFVMSNLPYLITMVAGLAVLPVAVNPVIFPINIVVLGVNFFVALRAAKRDFDNNLIHIANEELIGDLERARDISEDALASAKRANADLSSQEELFRALVENAKEGIILTDQAGNIRYMSPSIKHLGYDPTTFLGVPLSDLIPPDTRRKAIEHFSLQSDAPYPPLMLTDQILTPTGRRVWIEARITDMRHDPNVGGFIANVRDVTERKHIDDELSEHLEILNALAQDAPLDTILRRLTYDIEKTNPALRALLVLIEDGKPQNVVAPSLPRTIRDKLESGEISHDALLLKRDMRLGQGAIVPDIAAGKVDGHLAECLKQIGLRSFWSQPIISRKGRLLGLLAVFHIQPHTPSTKELSKADGAAHLAGLAIERRQSEGELREAMERAELANRAKSRFLATMSHELRTPLNAIIGFSEIMHTQLFGPLGDRHYSDYAKDILTSGRHLLSVIDDILDISKIEAGRYELEAREIAINDAVEWSVLLTQPKANEKHITIMMELAPNLPLILADLRAIRQILLNLLSNAVKFTPEHGIITIAAERAANGGLNFSVTDTGLGIPADKIEHVMQPFGQATNNTTEYQSGTGLGLPICKSLIEMHDGRFTLESEEGKGTRVTLWLPPERLCLEGEAVTAS